MKPLGNGAFKLVDPLLPFDDLAGDPTISEWLQFSPSIYDHSTRRRILHVVPVNSIDRPWFMAVTKGCDHSDGRES